MKLLIQSTSAAVIRRINHPKTLAARMTRGECERAKVRPMLSLPDEQDAEQTVALTLLTCGLPRATQLAVATTERIAALCPLFARSICERASYTTAARTLGLSRWKACFRAVRRALRIDRRVHEIPTDFSTASEVDIAIEHPQARQERRDVLARKLWYVHSLLLAAADAQKGNRKRAFNFRTNRALFAAHAACLTAAVGSRSFARRPLCEGLSESAARKARQTLKEYLDLGEAELTRRALEDTTQGARTRELRAFAEIPEAYAIAE